MSQSATTTPDATAADTPSTVMGILWALSLSHLLNDTIQSLIPALYPMLKENFALNFAQIGLITLAFNTTLRPGCEIANTAGTATSGSAAGTGRYAEEPRGGPLPGVRS